MKLNPKKTNPSAGGNAGGGAPVEKKAKRKTSRGSGDGLRKAKTFLAEHAEKLLLGMMAAVSLALVYSGFSKPPLGNGPAK